MDNGSNAAHELKELSSPEELAEYFGYSIATVYRFMAKRQIPFCKLGRGIKFKRDDVLKFIDDNRTDTIVKQLYERKKKI